ncbi:MAG TPA: DUF5658 family protein [Gemmatales bacterium]|nr:DUF5658 family protein [Gemmatales bacterium]
MPTNIPISSWLRAFTLETSRLQWLILLFLLVSIADLVTTYWLLSYSPNFYESNPVANWFFKNWNVAGMTFFKFAVVAFVVIISEYVERRRVGAGKFVLIVGILATAAVVTYSVKLYMGYQGEPGLR